MTISLRHFFPTLLLCICASAYAQVNVVRHTVEKGETLYHLSKTYGVTVDLILQHNPGISSDGLKAGSVVVIPAGVASPAVKPAPPVKTYTVKKKDTMWSIARANGISVDELMAANPEMTLPDFKLQKGHKVIIPQPVPDAAPQPVAFAQDEVRAAVLLPFSADGVEGDRSIEFYRGFLMGADRVRQNGKDVVLFAINETDDNAALGDQLTQLLSKGVELIVGPVYPQHFAEVSAFCRTHSLRLVIPFSSKADQVKTNPAVFLLNAPEAWRNEFAADLFLKTFKQCNVAFLHTGSAAAQVLPQLLRTRLVAQGCAVTDFQLDAPLAQMKSACADGRRTIIVPDAADEPTLQKILARLALFRQTFPNTETALVGYPEWLDGALVRASDFFASDTYIFTDHYFTPYTADTRLFLTDYQAQFKEGLLNAKPRMALLGHDAALHLLGGVLRHGKSFATQEPTAGWLQSHLRFAPTSGGGYVNGSMFLIHYSPRQIIEKLNAK